MLTFVAYMFEKTNSLTYLTTKRKIKYETLGWLWYLTISQKLFYETACSMQKNLSIIWFNSLKSMINFFTSF